MDGVWDPPVVDECKTPSLSPLLNNVSSCIRMRLCGTYNVIRMCYITFRKVTQGMDPLHGIPRVKPEVFHVRTHFLHLLSNHDVDNISALVTY